MNADQLPPLRPSSRDRRSRRSARRPRRSVLAASDVAGIVVLGVIGLAAAVVLALVIGHSLFLRDPTGSRVSASPRASARHPAVTRPADRATGALAGAAYAGGVRPAKIAAARATCGQHDLRTPAGKVAQFQAAQAIDGHPGTAWRCAGAGAGRRLTVTLRGTQRVAAVGLIPGYAGVDPLTGHDAFLRDRRILTVRWSVGAGTIVQTLDAGDRHLQLLRIPAVTAATLTMTILTTTGAGTDAFAVSDIAVYAVG